MITLLKYHNINKSQKDVDFIVPFFDLDRRFFIDPSLLEISTTPLIKKWNIELVEFLDLIREVLRRNDLVKLKKLLDMGEARDVGLGYCSEGISGSGIGSTLADQVITLITRNPEYIKRGLARLEELQWLDVGIGPDRVSDLCVHILKKHIASYTRKWCRKLRIPTEKVRTKVLNYTTLEWEERIEKLPINPLRTIRDPYNPHPPVLLLPKEIVKALPLFLNYNDFYGFVDPESKNSDKKKDKKSKREVIEKAVENPSLSDEYIKHREVEKDKLTRPDFDSGVYDLIEELKKIKPGREGTSASDFRSIVGQVVDTVFAEDLELMAEEKSTLLADKRRDLVYINRANNSIFKILSTKHSSSHIVVDAKNTDKVTIEDISRVSDYLGETVGMAGIIVCRGYDEKQLARHQLAKYQTDKKVILIVTVSELIACSKKANRIKAINGRRIVSVPSKMIEKKYTELILGA